MAVTKKLTKGEVEEALVEATGYTRSDVKHFLTALEELVFKTIKNSKRIEIAKVTIEPKLRAATKKRKGRNPATGEEITIPAKPASVKVTARVAKPLQEAAPSVRKLQAALGTSESSKAASGAKKGAGKASSKKADKAKSSTKDKTAGKKNSKSKAVSKKGASKKNSKDKKGGKKR